MDDIATTLLARHKLDADAFYRTAEVGLIGERAIELIDGELIDMPPIGDDHAHTVNVLNEILVLACLGGAIVSIHDPAHLDGYNVPQPDLTVLKHRSDSYRGMRPEAADMFLSIEVSDTSRRFDRSVKLRLYGQARIPEYWIVDFPNRAVIIHRQPSATGYDDIRTLTDAIRLPLAAAPEIVVDFARLFA